MGGSWIDQFKGLSLLPGDVRAELEAGSKIVSVPEGTQVFGPGQSADNLLLLLEGTVRVQQRSETGREVFLYRVHAGESCVLTTACMLAFEKYSADGIAETDVRAVAIPRETFDRLVAKSPVFRQFVFTAYSRRITDLFSLILIGCPASIALIFSASPDASARASRVERLADVRGWRVKSILRSSS